MADDQWAGIGRRLFIAGNAGLLGTVLTDARPAAAQSAARRGTLVIALDISDADRPRSGARLPVFQPAADPCRL